MLLTETLDWEAARAEAAPIRFTVFVEEQNVPQDIELDEHDAVSVHVIARVDKRAVGTGRLLPAEITGERRLSHIGRMAVRKESRGTGVGAAMLQVLIDVARARGDTEIVLSAQIHATGFYRRYGFAEEGEVYLDAGIRHRDMRLIL